MRRLALACLIGLWSAAASAASPIDGFWLTDDHKGVVRIGACGASLCGWIARVLDRGPNVPTRDVNNPNAALRSRPIVGMPVLTGFTRDGDEYSGGRAYDPQSGRSYSTTLTLNPNGSLNVTGCVLFICRTKVWTRAR